MYCYEDRGVLINYHTIASACLHRHVKVSVYFTCASSLNYKNHEFTVKKNALAGRDLDAWANANARRNAIKPTHFAR